MPPPLVTFDNFNRANEAPLGSGAFYGTEVWYSALPGATVVSLVDNQVSLDQPSPGALGGAQFIRHPETKTQRIKMSVHAQTAHPAVFLSRRSGFGVRVRSQPATGGGYLAFFEDPTSLTARFFVTKDSAAGVYPGGDSGAFIPGTPEAIAYTNQFVYYAYQFSNGLTVPGEGAFIEASINGVQLIVTTNIVDAGTGSPPGVNGVITIPDVSIRVGIGDALYTKGFPGFHGTGRNGALPPHQWSYLDNLEVAVTPITSGWDVDDTFLDP